MSFGEGSRAHFYEKTQEERERQYEDVERVFEVSMIPALYAEDTSEIMQMSAGELKGKFPERYRMYVELLRERKRMEKEHDRAFDDADIKDICRRLAMMNNLDKHVADIKSGEEDTHLRRDQINVFEDLRDFMERGEKSGYVELPTGTGKTVVFVELLHVLGVPALIVVPTKNLVEQTKNSINKFAEDLGAGAVYQKEKSYDANVVVTTYASLKNVMQHPDFDLGRIGVVILDEAHESLSQKRVPAVEEFKQHAMVIGFTATSEYSDTKNVAGLLGEEIHKMTLREAIEKRALAPCSAVVAKTTVDISKVKISSTGDFDPEELDKMINVPVRNKAAAKLATEKFPDKQKIIFCGTVKHVENIAQYIREAGQTVEVVVGETQDAVEKKYQELGYKGGWKEAYEKGDIKTVLTASLLTRGTDLPSAEICINAVPTRSLVLATQRAGRVTRLDPHNPNKHAIVIDIFDAGADQEETDRNGNTQVLFFKILGGATVVPRGSEYSGKGGGRGGNGGGGGIPDDIDIEGFEVVVDLEEMEKMVSKEVAETEEEMRERYREMIKNRFSAEEWVEIGDRQKRKFKTIDGKGFDAIANIFDIHGGVVRDKVNFLALGRVIYGAEVINALCKPEWTIEEYRKKIQDEFTAKEWVGMEFNTRMKKKFNKKGLVFIARVFGLAGNPLSHRHIYLNLGRAIYGDEAIEQALREIEHSPEEYRKYIKSKFSPEQWVTMTGTFRKTIHYRDKGLTAISSIFGIDGDPINNSNIHLELGRVIYGTEVIDGLVTPEWSVQEYRDHIKSEMNAMQWTGMTLETRLQKKFNGKGLNAIASIFGVRGNPINNRSVHNQLGRAIYGDALIDSCVGETWTLDQYRKNIPKKYSVDQWVEMTQRMRRKAEINKKGLVDIKFFFNIKGNPISLYSVHLELGRAIYGDEAIDQALAEKDKK